MIQYYKNITSLKGTKVRFTRDLHRPKVGNALEQEGGTPEPTKSDRSGESAIKSSRICCTTLIINRNFTKVQALVSGHADLGLSECNPTST